jgi:membrane protein required for colicin V production
MAMAWIDIAIIALIVLSAILSLFRGFVTEALALATQKITAFAILFILTLLLGAAFNYLAGKLVARTGLSGTDKMLGVIFGAARGTVMVAILVLLAGLTPVTHDPWWQDSQLLGYFEEFAMWMRNFLPGEIADNIEYV